MTINIQASGLASDLGMLFSNLQRAIIDHSWAASYDCPHMAHRRLRDKLFNTLLAGQEDDKIPIRLPIPSSAEERDACFCQQIVYLQPLDYGIKFFDEEQDLYTAGTMDAQKSGSKVYYSANCALLLPRP